MRMDLDSLLRDVRHSGDAIGSALLDLANRPAIERVEYACYLLEQSQRCVDRLGARLRGGDEE